MSERSLILVMDAGGSSSKGVLIDTDWNVISRGRGGPINITQDSRETIEDNLLALCRGVLDGSHYELNDLDIAIVGVAGWFSANWEEGKKLIRVSLDKNGFAGAVTIYHDSITTWAGATGQKCSSVVVYSGTGSFSFGRNSDGKRAYADILGPLLGDSGSGYWIGLRGLRAAIRSCEGRGESTSLEQLLSEHFGTAEVNEIVTAVWKEGISRKEIASLVPEIAKHGSRGDSQSVDIFRGAARRLVSSAASVINQLTDHNNEISQFRLYYSGGVFHSGDIILEPLEEFMEERIPGLQIERSRYGPLAGGFILGCNKYGISPPEDIVTSIDGASFSGN